MNFRIVVVTLILSASIQAQATGPVPTAQPQPPPPSPTQIIGLSPDAIKAIQDAITAAAASVKPVGTTGTITATPISTVPVSTLPIPILSLPTPTMLPKTVITAGGGYASPGGLFAYTSASTLALPQQTYLTGAIEYTLVKGQIETCALGGITKPMYQFWIITIGLTGLGGGCSSTSGTATTAGSGQGFSYFRWGKLPLGTMVTVMKNTNSGWKATLGFSWGQ